MSQAIGHGVDPRGTARRMSVALAQAKKLAIIFVIMGCGYFAIEGLWRGWTNGVMLVIGGLCGMVIDLLNETDRYYHLKVWQQSLIGLLIVWSVELTSGLILNVWLRLDIWDYSTAWGNVAGQICLPYGMIFFALVPFATWLGDQIRYRLFRETDRLYKLREIYWELITGK